MAATAMMLRAFVTALFLATIATTGSAKPIGALMTSDGIRAQLVDIQRRHVDLLHPDITAGDVNRLSLVVQAKRRLPRDTEDEEEDTQVCIG